MEELNVVETDEPSLPEGLQVSHPSDLPFHQVYHSYSFEGKKYISFRQYIFDTDWNIWNFNGLNWGVWKTWVANSMSSAKSFRFFL